MRYRFDGPSITNVASFSNGISTTQIISSSGANVTNIINTLSLYNYLRIIVNKNNGGTRTKISRAYFNGTFNDPAGQLGTNKNNNSFLGLDLSGEYLRLGIPNEINLKKARIWGRNASGSTDSNQSPQQYKIYQSSDTSTQPRKVARLRRSSDNAESDFYNIDNSGLKQIDDTTVSLWSGIVNNPTYDWNFREISGPNIKYIKIILF